MPFNRDLIESGCALKTFDGDLSVLERVIDWTLTKPKSVQQTQEVPIKKILSSEPCVDSCTFRQRRHIKEIVHGTDADELSSFEETGFRSDPVPRQVSKTHEAPTAAAASGFCFRHIAEDMESISHLVQQSQCDGASLQSTRPVFKSKAMQLPAQTTDSIRAARSVKDVVYGDIDFDGQSGQSLGHMRCETQSTTPSPVKHFKSCMREMHSSAESVPDSTVAAPKQMLPEMSHTHWRSAIHGF